jgi:hypothetical protein
MASRTKLVVIIHANKICAKKQSFLIKPQVLTWASCFFFFNLQNVTIKWHTQDQRLKLTWKTIEKTG